MARRHPASKSLLPEDAAPSPRRARHPRRRGGSLRLIAAGAVAAMIAQFPPRSQAADHARRPFVRLTRDAAIASSPGLTFFKIETPAATYYLEKFGGGIAAMIDPDGNDWIGFRPDAGSRAAGEFRGFPNAVHQQAGNYFHPRNQSTEEMKLTIDREDAAHIALSAVSGNQLWAGRYDFFPTHCTFTMTRMSPEHKYWILYEGVPGGKLDDTDWWVTSAIVEPQLISRNHEGDIPGAEWIAFGDARLKRVLYLLHHGTDEHPDRYYQMDMKMTVFGFGRLRGEKHFTSVPRSFSIGFSETTNHAEIGRAMDRLLANPAR